MLTAGELRTETLSYVKSLAPDALSGDDAAAVVRDLALVEKAAATGRMFAALRVAKTDAWRGQGHASAADWLAAQCGISVSKAQAQLRTAKAAKDLPKTKDAMDSGRLSPDQADAVTGAASVDPDAEDRLLDSSEHDTNAELRRKADAARAAATDAEARAARIRRERSVRYRTDADGAFHLHLRGPADDGARLVALLRPYQEAAFRFARRPEPGSPRDTFDNRTYDAFCAMVAHLARLAAQAESSTDGEPAATAPDDSGGACDPGDSGRVCDSDDPGGLLPDRWPDLAGFKPPGGNNTKVIIRIDHAALLRGRTVAGETCEIDGVGPIPASTVRDLLLRDDPFVAAVLTRGIEVQRVVHLGRGLSAHQRTAIEATGMRCSNVACNRTIAIQVDHREPWADDQRTVLGNQDPLCPECHRRKTHHGWHLVPGVGPRRFEPPDRAPGSGDAPASTPSPRPGPVPRPTSGGPVLRPGDPEAVPPDRRLAVQGSLC